MEAETILSIVSFYRGATSMDFCAEDLDDDNSDQEVINLHPSVFRLT